VALPLAVWEREILPSRIAGEDEDALDTLCQSGEVAWVASGKDAQHSRVRFMFRGEGALLLGSPAPDVSLLSTVAQSAYRFLQEEGASFTADMEAGLGIKPSALSTALAELATGGLVTNDTLDALRQIAQHSASPEARAALSPLEAELSRRPQAALRRPTPSRFRDAKRRVRARLKTESASTWPGRWSLVHRVSLLGPALSDEERASRLARVLLARYGVLMRECLESEEGGDWSQIYPHLERMEMRGELRRGYFVSGLSGAQFALPEAVEHLRAASAATDDALVTLNATDPAILPGAAFSDGSPRFARVPSTHCLWWRGRLVLAAEDGGKRITTGQDIGRDIVERALQQYVSRVSAPGHLVVAAWNGLPILETEGQAFLRALGFSRAPAAMERWR
ncbi:MAG: hypothetical protein HY259_07545, partial [Chloroflexi bacterium]|nr:hypothetical protein [Chloroflexota bacterium]